MKLPMEAAETSGGMSVGGVGRKTGFANQLLVILGSWLPDMDLNHDKQIQNLLCYRYTIGQAGSAGTLAG